MLCPPRNFLSIGPVVETIWTKGATEALSREVTTHIWILTCRKGSTRVVAEIKHMKTAVASGQQLCDVGVRVDQG